MERVSCSASLLEDLAALTMCDRHLRKDTKGWMGQVTGRRLNMAFSCVSLDCSRGREVNDGMNRLSHGMGLMNRTQELGGLGGSGEESRFLIKSLRGACRKITLYHFSS